MGGVRTKPSGESPTLKGLFAAGEAACWDMHGFNRLGGNSVAETVVAGMIVGEFIADFCDQPENGIDIPTSIIYDALRKQEAELKHFTTNGGSEDAVKLRTRMQEIMTTKIGIFRRGVQRTFGAQKQFVHRNTARRIVFHANLKRRKIDKNILGVINIITVFVDQTIERNFKSLPLV